jgi:polynucleotide 5'-hydroxyl-kinase GRC3/NOL9
MSGDWADKIAQQLLNRGLIETGICLILGAADTGKTTLAAVLAKYLARQQPVGIVDADIGQSHIGPPTTVGWSFIDNPQDFFSQLAVGGISFVGDVTPVGHLLQLTAAIVQCVRQVSEAAELMIIDTPGFINGPAAATLWCTLQQILKPKLILAVQRDDELSNILGGLRPLDLQVELIESPRQIRRKSPQDRRSYRQSQFIKYFRDSRLYNIRLSDITIQPAQRLSRESLICRLVALRDGKGTDVAIGVITDWRQGDGLVVIKAPQIDVCQIRCIIVGDVTVDIAGS